MSSIDLVLNSFRRQEGGRDGEAEGETEVWGGPLSAGPGARASLVFLTHSCGGGITSISHTERRKPSKPGPLVRNHKASAQRGLAPHARRPARPYTLHLQSMQEMLVRHRMRGASCHGVSKGEENAEQPPTPRPPGRRGWELGH